MVISDFMQPHTTRLPQSLRSFAMTTPTSFEQRHHEKASADVVISHSKSSHRALKRRHHEEAAGRRGDLRLHTTSHCETATLAALLRNDNICRRGRSQPCT